MFRISTNEKLIVRQRANPIITPWRYKIWLMPQTKKGNPILIKKASGITEKFKVVDLTGDFEEHFDRAFYLEIKTDNDQVRIDRGTFVLTGPYNRLKLMQEALGLLGENMKEDASIETDFQDGHGKHSITTIFTENTLSTEFQKYEWTRRFSGDFIPDQRFHIFDEKQADKDD